MPGLDLRHMITRKTVVWLIAGICVALQLILWLLELGPSNLPVIIAEPLHAESDTHARAGNTQQMARFTVQNATAENLDRLSEAVKAFATANLELPDLDISFHTDLESCGEHHGFFRATSETWQIRICSSDMEFVYEHELAHAWVTANVDEGQRSAFIDLRGLEHWAARDVPWNERGTEWAAVIIQQGMSGHPLPPALSSEAKSRLQSFELLTGRAAPSIVDWIRDRDVPCSDRPTHLSQPIADMTGRVCAMSPACEVNATTPDCEDWHRRHLHRAQQQKAAWR